MNRDKRKKHIQKIAISAMLVGVSACIGYLCRLYLTFAVYIRITFENLPIILIGVLFGPFYGVAAGISSDLVSSVISGQDINPIITIGAGAVGLMSGAITEMSDMLKMNKTVKKILACVAAHVFGCIFIKTFGLHVYYFSDMSFWYLFGVRAGIYTLICAAETLMVITLTKNKTIKAFSNYEL